MWISELNTKELTDPAYVAFDDGTDTYKTEFNECVENAANAAVAAADLTQNAVAFTSGDASSPTAWTAVSLLTSGSTLATLFNRISTMVKNVRWLYSKLGTTDISAIGNGTVTGALSTLNGKVNATATSGAVDLKGYTSSNFYVFPSDGFVTVSSGSGATQGTYIRFICKTSDGTNAVSNYMNVTGSYQGQSVFVKKGMYGFLQSATATNNYEVTYVPLDL